MSVLLRQLLSLQDADVQQVVVELPAAVIPVDPRLRIPVTAGTGPRPSDLRAPLGLVWHRALPARLAAQGAAGEIHTAPLLRGEFVVAVTDRASAARAESLLLTSLIKPTDGVISRAINRRISLRITRALLDTALTPNQMTWVAALFGALAIALVAWGGAGWLVAGALLLQVQSILDGCDGEISRLKYIRSRLGEWLDQVLDDVVNLGYFLAAGWAVWQEGSVLAFWLTVTGGSLHVVYQVALYAALLTRGGGSGSVTSVRWWGQAPSGDPAPREAGLPARLKEGIEVLGRRDFFVFLFLPAAIAGLTEVALAWCAIIFAVSGLTTGLQWVLKGGPEPAVRTS
jgi:phosphatidylglycerophosphate synthase